MKRWAWAGACATVGAPQSLIAVVLMLSLWAGIAEVVSAANALHRHDEIAAITLTCVNAPFAGWLFANFLRLRYDLRELHTPQRRQLLAGSLTFFLVIMVVAPCALALSWRLGLLDVLLILLGPLTGAAGAALWTLHSRARVPEQEVSPDRAIPACLFRRIPSHDRAIRLALGPPYAPASWRWRLAQFALVLVVLFAPALLVIAFGRSLNSRAFAAVMHTCEFLSFGAAIALCWLWPLSRALALFNPERGASMELALLPGLGGRQSLRRICRVALGLPALALAVLLLIALGAVWLERPPDSTYLKVGAEFSLIALFTLPVLLGQIVQPGARRSSLVLVVALSPLYALNSVIWNGPWKAFAYISVLRWVGIAIALGVLTLIAGMSLLFVRQLVYRPHPFVDVSS